jgi:hypothetical protein
MYSKPGNIEGINERVVHQGEQMNRKSTAVLVASLFATVSAVTGIAPAADASSKSAKVQPLASCVSLVGWSTSGGTRYVTVTNNCSGKKCYRVDIPWTTDPLLSVAGYATETDNYTTTFFSQGRGIYDASC